MTNFEKPYWTKNYSDPMSMDGIGNAKAHVQYLKSYLALEYVDISSIIDLGFGYGHLFREMLRTFLPHTAVGIEPSEFAFNKAKPDKWRSVESMNLKLYQEDLLTWTQIKRRDRDKVFDLGLCTSVLQYLSDKEIKTILPVMAQRIKFLYFTVPTDIELSRQVSELEFKDEYAIHRTREKYQKLITPHFTFISSRVLESKIHYSEETTPFTDLLYRY